MTTAVKTSVPNEEPTRRIIGWRDEHVGRAASTTTEDEADVFPWAVSPFGAEDDPSPASAVDVVELPDASPPPSYGLAGVLAPVIENVHSRSISNHSFHGSLTGVWANHLVANGVKTFGTAATTPAWAMASGVEQDWVFLAPVIAGLVEHHDFYSSALPELAQIELTIESINESMRESMRKFVGEYVRDHGHAYYVAAEADSESTGLAYTDRLGDYPPLPRVWEDVEVVIGTEDEIVRRVYTDEDHQVWRI